MKKSSNKGFTLVELIIVIAILAIIMLIAIPNFSGIQQRMQVRADKATAAQIGKAVRVWFTDCTTDGSLVTGDTAETLKPDELAVATANANAFSITATKEYDALVGIDGYMSKGQKPSSLKDGTTKQTVTTQRYAVFLTAAHNSTAAKIAVMVVPTTDPTGSETVRNVGALTELKGVSAAAGVLKVSADYDGSAAGVAYIEP